MSEEWNRRARRVLQPPFDPWAVLDSFEEWFALQVQSKGFASVDHRQLTLELEDGTISPSRRAEAVQRVMNEGLTPRGFWESLVPRGAPSARARLYVRMWWDFRDNDLWLTVNGDDRDEVVGFGNRVQAWLDALQPDVVKRTPVEVRSDRPEPSAPPPEAAPTVHVQVAPESKPVSKSLIGWVAGVAAAVVAGFILHAAGWV
jgi:hypothetical protein